MSAGAFQAREPRPLQRLWWITAGTIVALLTLWMTHLPWQVLGRPFTLIQFPYRLSGLATFAVVVLLALSLRLTKQAPWPRMVIPAVLGALVVVTAIQAGWQLWNGDPLKSSPLGHNRLGAFAGGPTNTPQSWYGVNGFGDSSRPLVATTPSRAIEFPVPHPGATRLSATVAIPQGRGAIATNISGGPYVIAIDGVRAIGRTSDGHVAVAPLSNAPRRLQVTIRSAGSERQTAADIVSVAAIVGLVTLLVALAVHPAAIQRRVT